MIDYEAKIPNTELTLKDLSKIALKRLSSIFLLDIDKNIIVPLKSSIYKENTPLDWDKEINNIIESNISTQFQAMAKILYSRTCVEKQINTPEQNSELIIKRKTGELNNLNLFPIKIEDNKCKLALIFSIDITNIKNKTEKMEKQMASVHKDMNELNRLFISIARNYYTQVIKFDIVSGDTSKINFKGNTITETPMITWTLIFEKNFKNVHPDDYNEVTKYFDIKSITEMTPGTKKQITYRAKNKTEGYRWYRTIIILTEDEPTTAIALTSNITKDLLNNTVLSNLLY